MIQKLRFGLLLVLVLAACGPAAEPTAMPTAVPPTGTAVPPTATAEPTPAGPPVEGTLGDRWTRPSDGMVMLYVPGGTFLMGSEAGTPGASPNEFPQHPVTLASFWIGLTEVTNAQYAQCVAAGACEPPGRPTSYTRNPYFGDSTYDAYPVIQVNWYAAQAYCEWAGARLPSEAEWEYAARGPQGSFYPWGNTPPDETLLNYEYRIGDTTAVGSYPEGASWCGALDMAGNVWELVADRYGEYPAGAQENPTGPSSGELRLLRGGSWWSHPSLVRSAARMGDIPPDYYHVDHGFRCAWPGVPAP